MPSKHVESVVRAAVLGLLAASQPACSGDSGKEPSGAQGENSEGSGSASSMGDGKAAAGGSGNVEGVTSSRTIADLGLNEFTEMCDEANGVVEEHATCGGVVSGPGFSYDSDTDLFTEHTCRGFNTCRGFSCVLDT